MRCPVQSRTGWAAESRPHNGAAGVHGVCCCNPEINKILQLSHVGLITIRALSCAWVMAGDHLPIRLDALCNGRAHPTGTMGSMGLHRDPSYVSRQSAAGGNPEKGLYLELHTSGRLDAVSPIIRAAADRAGGLVAVARNPVKASYVKKYGAPGALKQAITLGQRMTAAAPKGGEAVAKAAVDFLGGTIVLESEVSSIELETKGGFDSGRILFGDFETTFWNEYMTLEKGTSRLATFPDLIMTLYSNTGMPVTTAELRKGDRVFLIQVPAEKLILGEGMRCEELLRTIEPIVNKSICNKG